MGPAPPLDGAIKGCSLGWPDWLLEGRSGAVLCVGQGRPDLEALLVLLWLGNWRGWLEVVSDLHRCCGHEPVLNNGKCCCLKEGWQ